MPRTFSFNRYIGVDIFYVAMKGKTMAFLNIICHGTNFQQIEWIKECEVGTPSSKSVWRAFLSTWLKPFGNPEVLMCDGGPEFKDTFERHLEQFGILQVVSDAASPWQNGRVERHGGWLKEKAESELSSGSSIVRTQDDLHELMSALVASKNRWFNVGGYSPYQLVFGANPSIPFDLLSEASQEVPWQDMVAEPFDLDTAGTAFAKSQRIRQRARELCVQFTSREKVRLSTAHRPHRQVQWAPGQWVLVWRRSTQSGGGGHITRSRRVGPGVVILQTGHTVFVSMRSRLWKCNTDQLRPATHFESVGAELARAGELQGLLQAGQRAKVGALDVSMEGSPPDEALTQEVPDPSQAHPSVSEAPVISRPSKARAVDPLPTIPEEAPVTGPGVGQLLRHTSPFPNTEAESRATVSRRTSHSEQTVDEPSMEPGPEEQPDKRRRVSTSSSVLDQSGTVRQRVAEVDEAENLRLQKIAEKELRRLDRADRQERLQTLRSQAAASTDSLLPDSTSSSSRTGLELPDQASPGLDREPELFCFSACETTKVSLMVKPVNPKNSEFDMSSASPEEIEGFKVSDALEWKTIEDLKAARVITGKEASDVRKQFSTRIMSSRMIRRNKPMPGVGNWKFKSRWCLHGHHDPDSGSFKTFSPMPSAEAINLFFQLVLNMGFLISFADVQSAFCQSKPLKRPQGRLFAEPCSGLNLPEGALIEIIAPIYGLDDAPWLWHETLQEFFGALGFRPCLLESCWLIKEDKGKIVAFVLIEVDDLNIAATPEYFELLRTKLTERFKFGKWEFGEADFAGRHVKFESDRVLMDQEKYILEKLHTIKAPKGHYNNKEQQLTGDLFEQYRSMLYRVNWLAHQTRPEAAGAVSILSSRLNKASLYDLGCLNRMVQHIKGTASQPLVLHRFDNDKMLFISASDAGGVGSKPPVPDDPGELTDTVQGAWIVFIADQVPSASRRVKVSTVSWRSARLKRKVSSTLASETLALSQSLSEVEWLQMIVRDVLFGDVSRSEWHNQTRPYLAVLNEQGELRERLGQCSITDAKSLFDSLVKGDPSSRQDRRTAIEIAIVLEALKRAGSTIRWSPHPRMVADALTKADVSCSNGALEETLRTSRLSLWDEASELERRKMNPNSRLRSKKASSQFREDTTWWVNLTNKDLGELIKCYLQFECEVPCSSSP